MECVPAIDPMADPSALTHNNYPVHISQIASECTAYTSAQIMRAYGMVTEKEEADMIGWVPFLDADITLGSVMIQVLQLHVNPLEGSIVSASSKHRTEPKVDPSSPDIYITMLKEACPKCELQNEAVRTRLSGEGEVPRATKASRNRSRITIPHMATHTYAMIKEMALDAMTALRDNPLVFSAIPAFPRFRDFGDDGTWHSRLLSEMEHVLDADVRDLCPVPDFGADLVACCLIAALVNSRVVFSKCWGTSSCVRTRVTRPPKRRRCTASNRAEFIGNILSTLGDTWDEIY